MLELAGAQDEHGRQTGASCCHWQGPSVHDDQPPVRADEVAHRDRLGRGREECAPNIGAPALPVDTFGTTCLVAPARRAWVHTSAEDVLDNLLPPATLQVWETNADPLEILPIIVRRRLLLDTRESRNGKHHDLPGRCLEKPHDVGEERGEADLRVEEWRGGRGFARVVVVPTAEAQTNLLQTHVERQIPDTEVQLVEDGESLRHAGAVHPPGLIGAISQVAQLLRVRRVGPGERHHAQREIAEVWAAVALRELAPPHLRHPGGPLPILFQAPRAREQPRDG
eukprot:CAMPEP_0176196186 /NCGR_PEP_ID=MMETSP0121_2-20121125/6897_1 /TAXON_ID=160619 /ORGANISM="Kryptoperidinium foliaceum, Strain CCMP 1326" /LENGTH=281 /DNA_ID=CAMNT_0017534977 /DNA_START=323 /DNA_END=1164 /DNA_ORIENTATION=+